MRKTRKKGKKTEWERKRETTPGTKTAYGTGKGMLKVTVRERRENKEEN